MTSRRKRSQHPKTAFTLVELLVVIAIISILAGLLLPALENAIGSARAVHCANNLRQMAICSQMYMDEFSGYLPARDLDKNADTPSAYSRHALLFWYLYMDRSDEAVDCPTRPRLTGTHAEDSLQDYADRPANTVRVYWRHLNSYAYNGYYSWTSLNARDKAYHVNSVQSPEKKVQMFDSVVFRSRDDPDPWTLCEYSPTVWPAHAGTNWGSGHRQVDPAPRHLDGSNYITFGGNLVRETYPLTLTDLWDTEIWYDVK